MNTFIIYMNVMGVFLSIGLLTGLGIHYISRNR